MTSVQTGRSPANSTLVIGTPLARLSFDVPNTIVISSYLLRNQNDG